jgi:hypothetical protein
MGKLVIAAVLMLEVVTSVIVLYRDHLPASLVS